MEYQHLLMPVDLNDPDLAAVDVAFELALQHRARTTLLHEIDSFYAELEASVRIRLEGIIHRFEQSALEAWPEIVVGHRACDIVQYSATQFVDLIIMRSRRVNLNHPHGALTSVSHQVSMFCQCPVMLVK